MTEKKKIELINRTDFSSTQLKKIANTLLEGKQTPNFYLVCQTPNHDGLTITNLDKPVIIVAVKNLNQFGNVLAHELIHLQQHAKDYADHDFPEEKVEVIVTDKHKTEEEKEQSLRRRHDQ